MSERSADAAPHRNQRVVTEGRSLEEADAAMVLVHGRGATPESIVRLAGQLDAPNFAFLAPAAAQRTWYPQSFLAPIEENEPYLSSALELLGSVVERVTKAGLGAECVMLLGFSQGACLTSEFVARHPSRYGGVAALTGGLIGPDGTPRNYSGSLDGTPVFLGTSDSDPHVPKARVDETAEVLTQMGAQVTKRVYPGMGHTINDDELSHVQQMVDELS